MGVGVGVCKTSTNRQILRQEAPANATADTSTRERE